jgi:hypothetical protein
MLLAGKLINEMAEGAGLGPGRERPADTTPILDRGAGARAERLSRPSRSHLSLVHYREPGPAVPKPRRARCSP